MFLPENRKTIVSMFLATTSIENSTTRIDSLEMHLSFLCIVVIYIQRNCTEIFFNTIENKLMNG